MLPENRVFPLRARLADLARQRGGPTITMFREFTRAGFLISYGANVLDLYGRAAAYVDRILRGARAADLPIEQPVTFDFVVNLRTARAIGLELPRSVLVRADEIIE